MNRSFFCILSCYMLAPISFFSQVKVVTDENQNYKKQFILIKPLEDQSKYQVDKETFIEGTYWNSVTKKSVKISGEKISAYYGYIDDSHFENTGLFQVKKYGSEANTSLMDAEGNLLSPINPNNHFTIDTVGERIYNIIYDNKKLYPEKRIEVYDFDMDLISSVTSNDLDVSNIQFQSLTQPSFIFAKHSEGILILNKNCELICRFNNTESVKYRKIKSFKSGFGLLEYDTLGYVYDKIINNNGVIVFQNSRTSIKRIDKDTFESYDFEKKENAIINIQSLDIIDMDVFKSEFKDFESYSKFKDIYIATYKNDNSKNGLKSNKALIFKNKSVEKILIPYLDENYRIPSFRVSDTHKFLNSRGEIVTNMNLVKTNEGQVFLIDKYGELIRMKKDITFISFRRLSKINYKSFDSLFVYKIDKDFYFFNPMSTENKIIGPFLSVSEYNTDSEGIFKPCYLLYGPNNTSILKLKNSHWTIEDFSTTQIVKTNDEGQQGVWDQNLEDWIILPRYFIINQFNGAFFCKNRNNGRFTVFNSKGLRLVDNILGYKLWSENKNYSNDQNLIEIYSALKTCKMESGKIKSYVSSRFYGLIDSQQIIAQPNFEFLCALPGTNYFACFQTHCNENKSFIFALNGRKIHQSNEYFISYDKRELTFKKCSFIVNPKTNYYEILNSNKNLHQLVNLEEKETFEFVDVRVNNQKNNRISVPTDNVSGTNAKPNIDHYSIDGYTLTKYIKISDVPALQDKLTEFTSTFHKIDFSNASNRWIFREHNIPGYIVVRGYLKEDYYFNQKAIKIIYEYLSGFGYDYFTDEVLIDLPMNDKRNLRECKKTYTRNETIECPNCSYWTDKQRENFPCTKCRNKREISTGKVITGTCPSCNGKGYYYYSDENKQWSEVKEYYQNNQIIKPKLGFDAGGNSSDLKWKGMNGGTYFITKTENGLKYDGLGSYISASDKIISKYDFVQVSFQRRIK